MLKFKHSNVLPILLVLLVGLPAYGQMGQIKKKAAKMVKQSVKPLDIEFQVTKVKYDPMKSPDKAVIAAEFKGHNPNDLGVNLNRTEFDLYVADKFVAKFYNDKKIEIPKNGDFAFTEKASIKISSLGKSLWKVIKNDTAKYRIDGTYYVKTPAGEFSFKAELVEKDL